MFGRKIAQRVAVACLLSMTCCFPAAAQVPARGITEIREVEDVISNWAPDRQIFVKGNLGIAPKQLNDLATWLTANGPHWTVVLMDEAAGEQYSAPDGRRYDGMDAVEYALGHGLSNRTDFGKWEHPKTQERDGAIFALFLKDRKFSYFASDAQDRRGLGEASWRGQLDQPAFRAMRSGGRIIDAVKDTVQSINDQLERAIRNEADQARRAELERQRVVDSVKGSITTSRHMIDQVKVAAADYLHDHPDANGILVSPPLNKWRDELAAIEADLSPDTARTLQQRLAAVDDTILAQLNGYAAAEGLNQHILDLKSKTATLAQSPSNVAANHIAEINKSIESAKKIVEEGGLGLPTLFAQADASANAGLALLEQERATNERIRLARLWIWRTIIFSIFVALLVVLAILWILNYRRKHLMLEAIKILREREALVAKETEGIDRLFTRNEELLGSKQRIVERGYAGLTRQISEKALDYVDDLFIMSKEVRRVLKEAKQLVYPDSVLGKLQNLFSSRRYQQAINEVTGKPLTFSRLNGLPWVLREQVKTADGTSPEEVTLTFEEVFKNFQHHGDEAEQALNIVENCLTNVHDTLTAAQNDLEKCIEQDKQLDTESADGYFLLPDYLETLIPSIEKDLEQADQLSTFDAVGAMQEYLPAAQRKMSEGLKLGAVLIEARRTLFPQLQEAAEKLRELQFSSPWIGAELQAIGEHANELFKRLAQQSLADEVAAMAKTIADVGTRATQAVALAARVRQELAPEGEALLNRIQTARRALAGKLGLPESAILQESNRSPDAFWSLAGKSLEAAGAAVAQGQNEVAQAAVDAMLADVSQADSILTSSLQAVESFEKNRQLAGAELERLGSRIPGIGSTIDSFRHKYVGSTLQLRKDNPAEPPVTIDQLLQAACSPTNSVASMLHLAPEKHRLGNVLQAADILHDATSQVSAAHQQLDAIEHHVAAVDDKARENKAELSRLGGLIENLRNNMRDPLVTQQTLQAIKDADRAHASVGDELDRRDASPNPFEIASTLAALEQTLVQIDARCAADRKANAEAARAVAGARQQQQLAQQLVRQSQTDGIPDSPKTVEANNRIAVLSQSLVSVESQLREPHGDWKLVDEQASKLQSQMSSAADILRGELSTASKALELFQQASQAVFQAEQWSGLYGIRVTGSPGVRDLERARASLQQGNYDIVLDISRLAVAAALGAIQQAEREVQRRKQAEEREAEAARRRRQRSQSTSFGPTFGGGSFGGGSFGGGSFGGGSSSSGSSGSSSGGGGSGFSRSGW